MSTATWPAPGARHASTRRSHSSFAEPLNADPGVDAELPAIATGRGQIASELVEVPLRPIVRRPARRHPAVTKALGSPEHGLGGPAGPDGDGVPGGQRIDPGVVRPL
jgi:hypothetical protein